MIRLKQIGLTLKPHGKEGDLRLHVEDAFLDDFFNARSIFIDLDGSRVPFLIENIQVKNHILVKLEEIDSPEQAQQLGQHDLFMDMSELSESSLNNEETDEWKWLEGFEFFQEDGKLVGIVKNTIDNEFQLLLDIETTKGSFLWPLHDDFIINLDRQNKKLTVNLLEGYRDL